MSKNHVRFQCVIYKWKSSKQKKYWSALFKHEIVNGSGVISAFPTRGSMQQAIIETIAIF